MRAQLLRLIATIVVCLALPMLVGGCGSEVIAEQVTKTVAKRTVAKTAEKTTTKVAEKVGGERATKETAERAAKEEVARLAAGQPLGRGHSRGARWEPNTLREKLAMDAVIANPAAGETEEMVMGDSRWPSKEGWIKKRQTFDGGIVIHYDFNTRNGAFDDLKFKRGDDAF